MKFIKKHKTVLIICLISFCLIFLSCFAVYRMFYPNSENNRLSNAPEVDDKVIEQIKNIIMDSKLVTEVKYEKKIATMKFFIEVNQDVKLDEAKTLSTIILDNLSTKLLDFYDIEIFLTNSDKENKTYPAIGYRSKTAEEFSWVANSSTGEDDEK